MNAQAGLDRAGIVSTVFKALGRPAVVGVAG
jgi:1-deoxy-D-xylulose-5-phosphate synthase